MGKPAGILLAICVAILAACGSGGGSSSSTSYQWTGAELVHPLGKPAFTLTDDQGQSFNFQQETAGKVTLLYFGYTHCPNVCPDNMAMLAFALKELPANVRSHIDVVFVTTDPTRDTPPVLAKWLADFNSNFIGLTGTVQQVNLAQLLTEVTPATLVPAPAGSPSSNYSVNHAAQIIAYTPDNKAHIEFFEGMKAQAVSQDLDRLVTHGWTGA
jgi:protein SCO1/2